jgi:hypothetical protein
VPLAAFRWLFGSRGHGPPLLWAPNAEFARLLKISHAGGGNSGGKERANRRPNTDLLICFVPVWLTQKLLNSIVLRSLTSA